MFALVCTLIMVKNFTLGMCVVFLDLLIMPDILEKEEGWGFFSITLSG